MSQSRATSLHYHDNSFAGYFGINKTRELIVRNYYSLTIQTNLKIYVKGYDVFLALKSVRYKSYEHLQSFLVPTHCWKNLPIAFITELPIFTNQKDQTYDFIPVIVERLTKMIYYKSVKTIIVNSSLVEVIIDVVVRHHGLPDSIISNRCPVFTLKFRSLLCYFLELKKAINRILRLDRWANIKTKQHNRGLFLSFCELETTQLVQATINN